MAPSVLLLLTIVLVMGATGILGYKAKSPTDSELDKYGSDNESNPLFKYFFLAQEYQQRSQ